MEIDNINTPEELQKKNITAISAYKNDKIIIGTTEGLYSLNDLNYNTKLIPVQEFNDFHIWSIGTTNRKDIWVGTYGKGLKKYNIENNKMTSWDIDHPKVRTNSIYYTKTILPDSKNNVWVGYWGIGASRINIKTGDSEIWLYEKDNPNSLSHNDVWVIKEDRLGRIWLGTVGGGLNLFEDKDEGIFHHWLQNDKSAEQSQQQ